jgi:hypothetical protein
MRLRQLGNKVALLGILGAIAIGLFTASPAGAVSQTRFVATGGSDTGACTDPSTPCSTVSYALTKSAPGDTIDVSGTIADSISVNATVTIAQDPGGAPAVLNAAGNGSVATVLGGTVTFDGVTLENGDAPLGGGVLVNGGSLLVTNSSIVDNTTQANTLNGQGGAIYDNGDVVTILDSAITGNTASSTGGVQGASGGAIFNNHGNVTIDNSTIAGNTAAGENNAFPGQGGTGGAIYNNAGTLTVSNSTIAANTAASSGGLDNGAGGGVYDNSGTQTLDDSTLVNNVAAGSGPGAALFMVSSTDTLAGDIVANTAGPRKANAGRGDRENPSSTPATTSLTTASVHS